MEDDKIKDLFHAYRPELQSEQLFMARLQKNMDAVEFVRRENARDRRRSRIAVVIAALSGFVAGVVMTLLYPMLSAWLSTITVSMPGIGMPTIVVDGQFLSLLIIAAVCVAIVISTYELTLSQLASKDTIASPHGTPTY